MKEYKVALAKAPRGPPETTQFLRPIVKGLIDLSPEN
jgi:hypothetical protein